MDHDNATLVSKLEALLRNGKLKTDVVFLVGPDDNTVEEISAIKSDLVASSEYFSRLFSSTWSRPDEEGNQKIRLKNIEGRIFSLVVEYVHLNGLLLSKLSSLDECLQLMQAADEFLMKDLLLLCTKQLEGRFLAVDNVWKVLGDLHHCDEVASVCLKFLRQRTKDCLRHESFSGVGREPIRLFMALDQMQIDSELELLQACLSFSKSHDNPKEIFRQYFLPHLRLLTLSWNDVQVVKQMLTREEMASLAFYHLSANGRQPLEEPWPSSLCLKESRAKTKMQTLITVPESRVLDNVKVKEIFLKDSFEWVTDLCYSLILHPQQNIAIHSFEIFLPLNLEKRYFFDQDWQSRLTENVNINALNIDIMCRIRSKMGKNVVTKSIPLPSCLQKDSLCRVEHFALVPSGGTCILEVTYKGTFAFWCENTAESIIENLNKRETSRAFLSIEHTASSNGIKSNLNIFKNIHFTEVA